MYSDIRLYVCPRPYYDLSALCQPIHALHSYAEKSAAPVAAIDASAAILEDQTAPLWPTKVPILESNQCNHYRGRSVTYQSPVMPSRSMGLLSIG